MIELRFEPSDLLLVNKYLALGEVIERLNSVKCLLESGLVQLQFEQETAGKVIKLLGMGTKGFENVD